MSGFSYSGYDTNTFIQNHKLILASWDGVTEVPGSERQTVSGNRTLTRPVANEYGTSYNPVSFSYSLIREDGQPISSADQVRIEKWLTSPKYSSTLTLIDCEGNTNRSYKGKFIKTSWVSTHGGWAGVNFTFECVSPYAFKHVTASKTSSTTASWTLNISSDETEEYIYPVVDIYATGEATVKIKNVTDNNNEMVITTIPLVHIRIDCDKCLLSDDTLSGVVEFSDIGWDDLSNIYWLRLKNGTNTISITGAATVTLDFDTVDKGAGEWL